MYFFLLLVDASGSTVEGLRFLFGFGESTGVVNMLEPSVSRTAGSCSTLEGLCFVLLRNKLSVQAQAGIPDGRSDTPNCSISAINLLDFAFEETPIFVDALPFVKTPKLGLIYHHLSMTFIPPPKKRQLTVNRAAPTFVAENPCIRASPAETLFFLPFFALVLLVSFSLFLPCSLTAFSGSTMVFLVRRRSRRAARTTVY